MGLLGSADENLRALERTLAADLHVRGNALTLSGEPADVALAERVVSELIAIVANGQTADPGSGAPQRRHADRHREESPAEVLTLDILSRRGKTIRPKTLNQKRYVDAIDANTIVFGIGPAGTGKTYLAMAKAVNALQTKQVTRIILTRPAVEAGERLGFLPGTLSEKIDPYLRPLYDALHDMMDPELIPKLMSAGVIEVAPLAYMRGRAQPVFTKVLTPNGFRPIGELQVGDFVIGSDGRPTEVLGVYPQGFKEIYRVHTQDGSSTLASGDHLWSVYTREDRRRGKPARVLQTKDMIGNLRSGALPPLRVAAAECTSECSNHGPCLWIPTRSVCCWATGASHARPHRASRRTDPELAESLERLDSWDRGATQVRRGLRAQPGHVVPVKSSRSKTRSPVPCAGSGLAGTESRYQIHPRGLSLQFAGCPPGSPAGSPRLRRWSGCATGPDVPHPVHDGLRSTA